MYARVVTMTLQESADKNALKNFSDSLYFHPMYAPLVEELKKRQGFEEKLHALIERNNETKFISQVVFSSKEDLESYTNEDSVQSLWQYITQIANEEGINVSVEDTDKFLKF